MCSERTWRSKAVSEYCGILRQSAFGGKGNVPSIFRSLRGNCRQVMAEFCDSSFRIIVAKGIEHFNIYTLGELLPKSFGPTI